MTPARLLPPVLEEVKRHGFVVFDSADYDVNIVGCRNPKGTPNEFDDWIFICYLEEGKWVTHKFQCTTDPGLYWLESPMRSDGTAILKHPQQMRGAFYIGKHKNTYDCLRQRELVKVWRDNNKDMELNFFGDSSSWGIQIHRASSKSKSKKVGRWSAGCTVIADPEDYKLFMQCVKLQLKHHPSWDRFTYTLIEWSPE